MSRKILWALVVFVVVLAAIAVYLSAGNGDAMKESADRLAVVPDSQVPKSAEDIELENAANGLIVGGRLAGDPIVITKVKLSTPGYVVIHADNNGVPGTILAESALLPAGVTADVTIELGRTTKAGQTYWAMLHGDDGDGKFEFPGPDAPIKNESGDIVMKAILIN